MSHASKQAEIDSRTPEFMAGEGSKPFGWDPALFVEWATLSEMLRRAGLPAGASVLDVGCGNGWTTLFLAEAGYAAVGVDLVPANVELARARAERWGSAARFDVADMEVLDVGARFDAVLIFDALHHVARQDDAIRAAAAHLAPGGWLFLGEPTWLHRFSPKARRTHQDLGWLERGFTVRELRRDLRAAGFAEVRRFFQGSAPYEGWRLGPQVARLVGARLAAAPQHHIWLAAKRG